MYLVGPETMLSRNEAEKLSRNWWLLLANGILSIIVGILILSIQWTLATLAIVVGLFLAIRGILQAVSPPPAGTSRSTNIVIGILSLLVGASILAFPLFADLSLLVLAFVIGIWVMIWGVSTIVSSIVNRATAPHWWLSSVAGVAAVVVGFIMLYEPALILRRKAQVRISNV